MVKAGEPPLIGERGQGRSVVQSERVQTLGSTGRRLRSGARGTYCEVARKHHVRGRILSGRYRTRWTCKPISRKKVWGKEEEEGMIGRETTFHRRCRISRMVVLSLMQSGYRDSLGGVEGKESAGLTSVLPQRQCV